MLSDYQKFRPAIYKSGTLHMLPRPISALMIRCSWDARESKVPLKDGGTSNGQSKNAKTIEIQAKVAKKEADDVDSGDTYLTELGMFDQLTALETVLDTDDTTRYEFFIYHDTTGTPVYRKFKDCWTKTYDWSVGDDVKALFTYTATIQAEDPVNYDTAPDS